jgi:regulator of cell morphogenesis and NO signaling
MSTVNPETTIIDLAARFPAAARVFIERGIDFCCGGPRSLSTACREREIEPALVVDEINLAMQRRMNGEPVDRSPEMLVEFILDNFHRPLEKTLDAIEKLLDKAIYVHGADRDGALEKLREDFTILSVLLREQQRQKEDVLFPMIVSEGCPEGRISVRQMERGHTKVFELLRQIRCSTGKYAASGSGCTAIRALRSSVNELSEERYAQARIERYLLLSGALYV